MIRLSQDAAGLDPRYYNQESREGKSYAYQPYAQTYEYNQIPSAYVVPPVAQPVVQSVAPVAPVVPVTGNQYHAQDEAGQYSFGYTDPNSLRQEVSVDGVVRGGYKYVGQYQPLSHGWLDQSKLDRMIKFYVLKMMSCFI